MAIPLYGEEVLVTPQFISICKRKDYGKENNLSIEG